MENYLPPVREIRSARVRSEGNADDGHPDVPMIDFNI